MMSNEEDTATVATTDALPSSSSSKAEQVTMTATEVGSTGTSPPCLIVLGMAGSGKTSFVQVFIYTSHGVRT